MFDEIEANAANAAVVQPLQFAGADRVLHAGDTAVRAVARRDGVQRDIHVGAVTAGVHDHRPGQPQVCMQPAQILHGRIGGRVAAVSRVGKLARRTEDVAMRIAGPGRQHERGLDRIRIGRQAGFQGVLDGRGHFLVSCA